MKISKKSIKKSIPSIFSKLDYAVHESTLSRKKKSGILVNLCSTVIIIGHSLKRRKSVLDAEIEKGKLTILGKLRTIQSEEAHL